METKYEPIKFNSWQDLAKAVIDGGEIYIKNALGNYSKIEFYGRSFNYSLKTWIEDTYTKKQPTNAQMLTDDEIKQFLSVEQ